MRRGKDRRSQLIFWGGVLAVTAVLTTVVLLGANRPADPKLPSGDRTSVSGFGSVAYRVRGGTDGTSGDANERCALLAETSEQQQRGLMGRTDLGGYDGMLFRFSSDTTASFYMKDTLIPLSIAWFKADGSFVSTTDMEPCPDKVGCPTYSATGPYRYALEVAKGGLPALGVGPGAQLVVGGGGCG